MDIQTHLHGSGGLEHITKQKQHPGHQQQLIRQVYSERQGHPTPPGLVSTPDPNLHVRGSNSLSSLPNVATQLQMQREEMDQYIRQKNEELRLMIELYENQQVGEILRDTERHTLLMMERKEEELARVVKNRCELEEMTKGLEVMNRELKRIAAEKEAVVLALDKALAEEKVKRERMLAAMKDAESCVGGGNINKEEEEEKETAENQLRDQTEHKDVCKHCFSMRSCFLFLPCRHLVSCKACEAILHACPICGLLKKDSIETLFF